MNCSPQQCYAEFHMYPVMLRVFAHMLCDEYGLRSHQHINIYEQVGMLLCILAHGKGYKQVQTLFNYSLETFGHYFKLVLRVVLEFSRRVIRPDPNYNNYAEHHVPNLNKHPIFRDCIGTTGNSHDARILAQAIHNPEIEFSQPAPGKYYLVDSGFAHRRGYMAPYKGSDILYHFQKFCDGDIGLKRLDRFSQK
ncbi:uncharacterized protein LOC111408613 [Olea europaea var. sylvestris]|uniref:uncharacterized protein LOC111408613 n=1 Tax=Olea europaea var. sylvestris TaxID=158386 RepID=UPI000C1D84A2|nr:uncharacterized protein LOC111408613 [Olea europaea var. sylvestris]